MDIPFVMVVIVLIVIYIILEILSYRIPIKSVFNIHLVYKRISSYMLFMVLEATAVKHLMLMLISNTKNASA
jgi:high-affinity Fe2+/Pb2+ permease